MATNRPSANAAGRRNADLGIASSMRPELEPFVEALARLLVADFDRRKQRATHPSKPEITDGGTDERCTANQR